MNKFKVTTINILKDIVKKAGNTQDHVSNIRKVEILKEIQKECYK